MEENRIQVEDVERLQEAWGPRHRNDADFNQARDGDHLLVPFECILCVFRKLKQRNPSQSNLLEPVFRDCQGVLTESLSNGRVIKLGWALWPLLGL